MKKTFVFGDIHGCHQALVALLQKISPDPDRDTLVFLGDYINRGPDSEKVISELIRLKKTFQHVITLMGNHEYIFLRYLEGAEKKFFLRMGGDQTLKSYGITEPWPDSPAQFIPTDHSDFFRELLLFWENEEYIFVHAGMQPNTPLAEQGKDWLLWAREQFINTNHEYRKRVIYGHTPFKHPKVDHNKIGIDTGIVYGGKLTCLVLPDLEFIDQSAGDLPEQR